MQSQDKSNQVSRRIKFTLGSLALVSFSMILYEIVLTRIFSVLLSNHYVFAVLSLAMLGLGLGGLMLKRITGNTSGLRSDTFIIAAALVASVTTMLILYLSQNSDSEWAALIFVIILLLPVVPFLSWGIAIASFFQQAPENSSLLYGFDIAGGAIAAFLAVPLLDKVPATKLTFEIVLFLVMAALLYGFGRSSKIKTTFLALLTLIIASSGIIWAPQLLLPLSSDINKDINRILSGKGEKGRVVENRWSAFGETTMVENDEIPGKKIIYIDGAAGTTMYSAQRLTSDETMIENLTLNFGGFFPFPLLKESEKDSALIIGAGAGRDVVVAQMGGVKSITAVEVNRQLVDIVKENEAFNGGIYTRLPNVKVVVDEGRSFLHEDKKKYDLIILAMPVTKSSRSINGYALTENYLFTVEAFASYLDHLTPEGRIIFVTHGNAELYRVLSLVLKVFEERGLSNQKAMKHLYTVARHNMPTMVIRKKAFKPVEMQLRHAALHRMGFDKGGYFVPYQQQVSRVLPLPTDTSKTIQWKMFDQLLVDLSDGTKSMEDAYQALPINIEPVRDNNPFFYNFSKSLPFPFRQLSGLLLLGFGFLVMVLSVRKPPEKVRTGFIRIFARHPQLKLFLVLSLLLGMAFMMLEVALFQKLTLFLGNPLRTTAVLLFSLLVGGGLGALSSSRLNRNLTAAIMISGISVFGLVIIYVFALENWLVLASNIPLSIGLFTAVLGYAMGFPFPLVIRLLAFYNLGQYTYMMWGSNGIASVAGSVLAMVIGIQWGFSEAIVAGASLYLIVVLVILALKHRQDPEVTMITGKL